MTDQPAKPAEFFMTRVTRFHIGTIAIFQLDETDLLESLPLKIAGLSDQPQRLIYSRMGEDVPKAPRDEAEVPRKIDHRNFKLSYRERQRLDKLFLICYMESMTPDGEPCFAFVNTRGDRVESLLETGEKDEAFDLAKRATLVMVGQGQPDDEQIEKMRRDYMFGDQAFGFTHVRVFPPLSEVTSKDSKKPEVKKEMKAPFSAFSRFQIGCISTFGIDDQTVIELISEKLSLLNAPPGPLVYSKYGTEVPPPPQEWPDREQQNYDEIEWGFDELRHMDKVFVILFVASENAEGQPVFAYINTRGDRLRTLIYRSRSGDVYDLADYATLILNGDGEPDAAQRQKLADNYLFGDGYINVRIFPPLSDVTSKGGT